MTVSPSMAIPPAARCMPAWRSLLLATACLLPAATGAAPALTPGMGPFGFAGDTRTYAVTPGTEFAGSSFEAWLTVTLRSGSQGNGCAFFGMGAGRPSPAYFNEPTTAPSLQFRLAPSDFAGGQVSASVNGATVGAPFPLGDGSHRLRFVWDAGGRRAWLEIHPDWTGSAVFAPVRTMFLPVVTADFADQGRLFAGGASGVGFADFQYRRLGPAEIARQPARDVHAIDATAGTWLPTPGQSPHPQSDPSLVATDGFLRELGASVRPLVCRYSGSFLQSTRDLPGGKLDHAGSQWDLKVDASPVAGRKDALDLTLAFTLRKGTAAAAGVAAAFDFSKWSTGNYVLLPAAVYHGNRIRTVPRGYNAGLEASDRYRKDLPLTQGDLPRLEVDAGKPSKLEVTSCNVTTPAVCLFDHRSKRGFILLAEQAGRDARGDFIRKPDGEILDHGFAVEESPDRSHATVVVGAPGVRARKPEFIGFSASPDRGINLKAGDVVKLKLRLFSFTTPDIPGLLDRFMTVRKDLTGPNHPRKLVPASQVEAWMTRRIDSRYLRRGDTEFYCPENGPWIAFGWIGGWINTAPMLALGDAPHLERVSHTFDHGLKAQDPSTGYFSYAIRDDGNTVFRDPAPDMTLARTSGDILFWMIKQFELLKAQGRGNAIKPEWEASMKRLADGMVATWKKDGEWGKLINYRTGRVGEYNTTGGAMIIGGLALASGYFQQPGYLEVAEAAADHYYQRDFAKQGFTTGGCADILHNADSETAAGFMTALMALHETTGGKRWLEMSRNLANLTATWTVSHDYELPRHTELGGLGAKLAGVVWASTQNKHGAPGICTSSGDALFKIHRATGDARYAELIRDIIAAHGESIRPDGFTNERLTFCDADSRGSRGNHVTGWNETNGVLMAREIPGIYLRTDIDRFHVFDAVEARVLERGPDGVTLEIHNPTGFEAKVSILAENAAQAAAPLGYTAFIQWPMVAVPAGSTTRVTIRPDGSLR